MPPQQEATASPVEAAQIVTLTVYSSGTPTQSLPALSGGGGASVPIAAIVGGAVGGVALAVLLVIIWKHWGRVIKRTERQRRKEVVRSCILFGSLPSPSSPVIRNGSTDRPVYTYSKIHSPCGKTPGGMRRRVSDRNRSTDPCSSSIEKAAR
jgi:hypothetical protein